jgi:hypothetical protein
MQYVGTLLGAAVPLIRTPAAEKGENLPSHSPRHHNFLHGLSESDFRAAGMRVPSVAVKFDEDRCFSTAVGLFLLVLQCCLALIQIPINYCAVIKLLPRKAVGRRSYNPKL